MTHALGDFFTQDRVFEDGAWRPVQGDVTDNFSAIIDLANLQQGWVAFPKGEPPWAVMFPAGGDIGEAPSDDHKQGLRVLVKMQDGPVRELMSSAISLWCGVDELHDAFIAAVSDHPGEVPICELADVREIKNQTGRAYQPSLKIVDWVPRPADLASTAQAPQATPKPAAAKPKPKQLAAAGADLDDEIPFK